MSSQALRRVGAAVGRRDHVECARPERQSARVLPNRRADVPRTYPGAAPCNTTLQACIDGSPSGDVINIAAGLYITSATLNKAVSLIGASAASTIIQALPGQRVLTVTAAMNDSTQSLT